VHDNPFSLEGMSILVTGASSGIGREVAVWLSRQGARIVAVARDTQRLEETLGQLHGQGHVIEVFDFLGGTDVSAWMKALARNSSPFDGLVHAAGVQLPLPIRAMGLDHWETIFATNVTSGFSLIMLSSVMAQVAQPALMGYCASKGAVESMVRAAALELAREGVRVNAVAPGVVRTEMAQKLEGLVGEDSMATIERQHPLGLGEPRDVAYAVNYLLSPAARWVTGTSLVVDGGYLA
jgi:NAD(P)-dependent dehydrogenase (short-subunit alcohol dehydrogenase family)